VPTRKQRRRRQKERRHEYEYVYVDDEGRELDVDEDESQREPTAKRDPRRNGKGDSKKARSAGARPPRKVDPPSWARSFRRALFFGVFIFVAFGFINNKESLQGKLALTVLYTAFFIPFMYLMDRAMYRAYLRRIGRQPEPRSTRRR
jgi:hypothetical protein